MKFEIESIGIVSASRTEAVDDFWGDKESIITLNQNYGNEAVQGLDSFSHVEVLFVFNKVKPETITTTARHPRNNTEWPKIGIFAQRGKNRPNRIGSTICKIVRLEAGKLIVSELDAIEGTPIIDLKPVMSEFMPREEIQQPRWSTELMANYWRKKD
ncbi:MAG: SAM-dependent methyltransferase [Oceanicoccus sp.]